MDSRIREALDSIDAIDHNSSIISDKVREIRSLLTAEPEPCEDAGYAGDAADNIRSYILSAEDENDHGIACQECWTATYKKHVAEIISQVADKRVEELRNQVETLRSENDRLRYYVSESDLAKI